MVPYTNPTKWVRYRSENLFNRKSMSDFGEKNSPKRKHYLKRFFSAPHGEKKGNYFHIFKMRCKRLYIFPWLKLKMLRTIHVGVLIMWVGGTNFDVLTPRRTVKFAFVFLVGNGPINFPVWRVNLWRKNLLILIIRIKNTLTYTVHVQGETPKNLTKLRN